MDRFVVGVISGRSLARVLSQKGAVPGLVYAGNDGLEISGLGWILCIPGASDFSDFLLEIARGIAARISDVPEIVIETNALF
ncbi:MAG: hypothetical protein Ct9H300mP11_13250 [Chloroflexota bacterium]|nr:MAG: hypothetical protein Ct9H300mP11_13250 [Chloroflexota bacterium]